MTRKQRQGRNAAEFRHNRDRLVNAYNAAPRTAIDAGRVWYETALDAASRIARPDCGIPTDRAAAIIAVLSPQTRWRENVESARLVIESQQTGRYPVGARGYAKNVRKAMSIATGAEFGTGPGDGFGLEAPKVRSFFANIVGDTDAVTLDVWAMRAATGRAATVPSGQTYLRGVDWYRAAAKLCGESPRDFQAIVWIATRGLAEYERDAWRERQERMDVWPAC